MSLVQDNQVSMPKSAIIENGELSHAVANSALNPMGSSVRLGRDSPTRRGVAARTAIHRFRSSCESAQIKEQVHNDLPIELKSPDGLVLHAPTGYMIDPRHLVLRLLAAERIPVIVRGPST
jgi:hypothetical protein